MKEDKDLLTSDPELKPLDFRQLRNCFTGGCRLGWNSLCPPEESRQYGAGSSPVSNEH